MALSIHFLNVGHGDCTLIEHPSGRITMIDINNSKTLPESDVDALATKANLSEAAFRSSLFAPRGFRSWEDYYLSLLVDPVGYFRSHFPSWASVFRYIQTHPDMDHMSGLYRFFWQEKIALENMWDTAHTKAKEKADFEGSRFDYLDWLVYQLMRKGHLVDDRTHKVLELEQGANSQYYADDNITVLAPTADLVAYANATENWNNSSYVIRISHAGRSVILPGDAEKPAWDKIQEVHEYEDVACDVLKAAHHGRESGYSETAVEVMNPSYVICSVGKKPSTDASDEYASHGARVLSTRANGTIKVTINDDGSVEIMDHQGTLIGWMEGLRWRSA
jgi:beta-lactamase superfamily II metal-dependent hydrolase